MIIDYTQTAMEIDLEEAQHKAELSNPILRARIMVLAKKIFETEDYREISRYLSQID